MDSQIARLLVKKTRYVDVRDLEGSQVTPAYLSYIRSIGLGRVMVCLDSQFGDPIPLDVVVEDCKKVLLPFICSCGGHHESYGLQYCRQTKVCINEDLAETAWQMNDMLLFLQYVFRRAKVEPLVWYVDFTIGKDVRERVPGDNLAQFAGLAYSVMQEYFRKKFGFEVEFGMEVVPQFWSSEEPGVGYRPHLHCIIPRLFFDKKTGDVAHITMRFLGSYDQIEDLKVMWRRKFESVYGHSRSRVQGKYDKFSVKVKFKAEGRGYRRSMRHRLKYMYRGIVFDLEKALNNGGNVSEWNSEFVRWALLSNHKRHLGYGLLSAKGRSPKSVYMQRIGADFGTRGQRLKLYRRKNNPECESQRLRNYDRVAVRLEDALAGTRSFRTVIRRYDEDALSKEDREFLQDYANSGVSH